MTKYNIAPHVYCPRQKGETFEIQLKFGTLLNLKYINSNIHNILV